MRLSHRLIPSGRMPPRAALCLLLMFAAPLSLADMVMPEPPPELNESLLHYRTKEQRLHQTHRGLLPGEPKNYQHIVQQAHQSRREQERGGVSGDLGSGVKRYRFKYKHGASVVLPLGGKAVVRFFDYNGKAWNVEDYEFESQGFNGQLSALPSEMVITPASGSGVSELLVRLEGHPETLVLNVRSMRVVNDQQIQVRTALHTVEIPSYQDLSDYIRPDVYHPASLNPMAKEVDFSDVSQDAIAESLVRAIENERQQGR